MHILESEYLFNFTSKGIVELLEDRLNLIYYKYYHTILFPKSFNQIKPIDLKTRLKFSLVTKSYYNSLYKMYPISILPKANNLSMCVGEHTVIQDSVQSHRNF